MCLFTEHQAAEHLGAESHGEWMAHHPRSRAGIRSPLTFRRRHRLDRHMALGHSDSGYSEADMDLQDVSRSLRLLTGGSYHPLDSRDYPLPAMEVHWLLNLLLGTQGKIALTLPNPVITHSGKLLC